MRYHIDLKRRGIGDTVVVSGLVRDLTTKYPDIRISVAGNSPDDVFAFEPSYAGSCGDGADVCVELDYKPTIDRGRRGDTTARYCYAAHDAFEEATGIHVLRGSSRPHVVLGPDELDPPYGHSYAVVACGVKLDIPVKQAPIKLFQDVVNATSDWDWKQVGLVHDGRLPHRQTALDGADNLIARTSLRQLIRLVAHARVVLCHLSLPAVLASAPGTPCVVIAGGRETPTLFDDMGLSILHTIGRLPCCAGGGCYASAALPERQPHEFPKGWLCVDPVPLENERAVGRCMSIISVDEVLTALRKVR